MFPQEFIKRLTKQDYIDPDALLKALGEPSPISIRINPGKWKMIPSGAERIPWCETGFYLPLRPSFTLDPLFQSGCYYPREASGMFLEQIFKQIPYSHENIRVLDLCGAPGGKSTQLSDLIGPNNLLIANEVIKSRAIILSETITKWGSVNSIVTRNDPSDFGRLKGYFDMVLIDAPCSGEGMFRSNIAINEWSPENVAHCSERQKRIILDIWPALKENGILIYSTCTFNPGENEDNIKWLTEKHEAECLRLDVTSFGGIKEIDYKGIYGYGFYPNNLKGEGFFISIIKKTAKQEINHVKYKMRYDLKPVKNDLVVANRWSLFSNERILKWGGELYAVPCGIDEYNYLFENLYIVKAGTRISVIKKSDYLPTHDLALSQYLNKDAFPGKEINLMEAIAFLRRDTFSSDNFNEGWNILTYKNICIGFVKNIGKRINNYFPVEWRIRMNLPEMGSENIILWDEEKII